MLNNSTLSQDELSLIVNRAKKNLIDFQIANNPKYVPTPHLEVIARELEHISEHGDRDYKVLLVFVPPRHGKSELCSIGFPAWYLGNKSDKEIITVSYSGELAQDFGTKTRTLVDSPSYHFIFDIKLKEDEQAKAKWRTDKGGSYTSVGVGGAITGRGANILLFDDPIKNREEAESEVYREKVWQFFTSTAFTRLEPKGVVVVILTRWHIDDLAGRILSNPELKGRCKVIHFPAINSKGEALWPQRYGIEQLREIENTIGPYDFQSLYQGEPIRTEQQEFHPEWWKRIKEEEVAMMSCQRYLTIDTAISKKTQADYTGFVDNRVNQQNFWHIKAWHRRMSAEELLDAIFALHEVNKYDRIGIEKTIYLDGLKPFIESEQRRRGVFLPIQELQHRGEKKEIRIRGVIPRYASHSVFHIEGECNDLEKEMLQFPQAKHDDILDALAYQLQVTSSEQSGDLHVSIPEVYY